MAGPWIETLHKILNLVKEEQVYFEKNLSALAWVMWQWDRILYKSRLSDKANHAYDNNPKDMLYEEIEQKVSKAYSDLVYDAWSASIDRHYGEDTRQMARLPLELKLNKTMDEYLALCLNPQYEYNLIYPTKEHVYDHLLCVIGNGLDWNKDGFLARTGPAGTDTDLFGDFRFAHLSFDQDVKRKVNLVFDNSELKQEMKKSIINLRRLRLKRKEEKAQAEKDLRDLMSDNGAQTFQPRPVAIKKYYYPIQGIWSAIKNMPTNVHPSYIKAAIEICEDILRLETETNENKQEAKNILAKYTVT